DLAREVALRHRGGDFGDVAHLRGQVGRHRVDVVGEVLPGAGHAGNLRLATELALGADLARHPGDRGGAAVVLVDHRVDGGPALPACATRVRPDLAREVALRHRGGDFGDVAHLAGEVGRHRVHRVGEVGPGAVHARDLGLAAELALG